ncbi:DUF839 domain-containing protein [Actinocorallia lasiicapitis]
MDRRGFLLATGAASAAALAGPFDGVAAYAGAKISGYGRLSPVKDLRDGKVRLHLPKGFHYRSFNPTGSRLSDGYKTPGKHDGMGAFKASDGATVLVRNHEVYGPVGAFGDVTKAYDPAAGGGTCTLKVNGQGKVLRSAVSLNGTMGNCSGGRMPWGAWVTCEETVNGPDVGNDHTGGDNSKLKEKHGYIFEVGVGEPITKAGRFAHESVALDPRTGYLYLTEDDFAFASGFYRYLPPKHPVTEGRLLDGGRLQMLAVKGKPRAKLYKHQKPGATYETTWVDVDDPDPTFAFKPSNDEAIQYVARQGHDAGGAVFARLEGAVFQKDVVYFVSTQGGANVTKPAPSGFGDGRGQVWAYNTRTGRLKLVVESKSREQLDLPDNITHSPRGTLVLCEDGNGRNFLRGLTLKGKVFTFAQMHPVKGDPGAEFAGSTFGPGGKTLFVNVQSKTGLTFAIWGPWQKGPF